MENVFKQRVAAGSSDPGSGTRVYGWGGCLLLLVALAVVYWIAASSMSVMRTGQAPSPGSCWRVGEKTLELEVVGATGGTFGEKKTVQVRIIYMDGSEEAATALCEDLQLRLRCEAALSQPSQHVRSVVVDDVRVDCVELGKP